MLYIGKGFSKVERVDDAWVQGKYGVPAASYADFATLRGDPSDGLPGVRGVGDKSAAAVIAEFGTIEDLLTALQDPDALVPFRAKLEGAHDYLTRAIEVVRVRRDVPVPPHVAALPRSAADPDRLAFLSQRWGIGSSVARLSAVLGI